MPCAKIREFLFVLWSCKDRENLLLPEPNLICVSQVPAAAGKEPLTFHSTKMAPGVGPLVEKMISVISIVPVDPGAPTCTITCGLVCDWNVEPVPKNRVVHDRGSRS